MSFSSAQITDMLGEYEETNKTGMNVAMIAEEIYQYTSRYPYLVSSICKIMDKVLLEDEDFMDNAIWTKAEIAVAVNIILKSKTPLFDSMMK